MVDVNPWDNLGEPNDAYSAFRFYLALPEPRRVNMVATAFPNVTVQTLWRWSREWFWKERAAAWDRHLLAEVDAEVARQWALTKEQIAEQHLAAVRPLLAAVQLDASKYLRQVLESPTPVARKLGELTLALQRLVQVERLVRGDSTERIEHAGLDLSKLSDEDLRAAEALIAKANAPPEATGGGESENGE